MIGLIGAYLWGKNRGRKQTDDELVEAVEYPELRQERANEREEKKKRKGTVMAWVVVAAVICWVFYALGVGALHAEADTSAAEAAKQFTYDEGGAQVKSVACNPKDDDYVCNVKALDKTSPSGYSVTQCVTYRVRAVDDVLYAQRKGECK